MIDGRGRAKITDFGLATLAETLEGADIRSGTPGYMAPEQLAGKEVTVRSDVYALGLVLFELLTGRRAFEGDTAAEVAQLQQETTPTDPSSYVKDLDPALERVILRCIERDPVGRPASALAVAAALPGGDPLAAALAEGETPSPEMVAAAGPQGGLRPRTATICLVVALVGVLGGMLLGGRIWIENRLPWVKSYEALRDDAREIATTLGYQRPPRDFSGHFQLQTRGYLYRIRAGEQDLSTNLQKPGREVLRLFYRQSRTKLVPSGLSGRVSLHEPLPEAGDVTLELDLEGRLRFLRATPRRVDRALGPDPQPDWRALFDAAGADIDRFEPAEPTIQPPVFADTRAAWTGSLSEREDVPVRIEAAALRGRPVYFQTIEPSDDELWSAEDSPAVDFPVGLSIVIAVIALTFIALLLVGAVVLAIRSLRLGRGDRKGALRVALAVFAFRMLYWLLAGHHVAHVGEVVTTVTVLCGALTLAMLAWLLYLALEPYVRRFWPEAMVSWNRLLAGRIRDPLVGRDVLVGFTFLGASNLVFSLALWLGESAGFIYPIPRDTALTALKGGRFALGALFSAPLLSLTWASVLMFGFLLLRIIVRKTWIALILLCSFWGVIQGVAWFFFAPPDKMLFAVLLGVAQTGAIALLVAFLLVRFGFLALIAQFLLSGMLASYPQSMNPSLPYFTSSLIGTIVVVVIGVFAYRASMARRPLFHQTG
jgi:serine/threonine-protein kinase